MKDIVEFPVTADGQPDKRHIVLVELTCDAVEIIAPSQPDKAICITPSTPELKQTFRETFEKASSLSGQKDSVAIGIPMQEGVSEHVFVRAIIDLLMSGKLSECFDSEPIGIERVWLEE